MNTIVKNPYVDLDYAGEEFIPLEIKQIYDFIDQNLVDRQDFKNVLRASAAPLCVRKRWLQSRGIKGHRMAPRSIANFILGDLYEHAIKYLISKSNVGPGKLYSEVRFGEKTGSFIAQDREFDLHKQIEVITKIGPIDIPGHCDGLGKRNFDGKWEFIEAKSANNTGFQKFQKSGPKDYLKQSHIMMMSDLAEEMDIKQTRYFFGRKQSGHQWSNVIQFNSELGELVKREYVQTMAPFPPAPPHSLCREVMNGQFTGRLVAPSFPCGLCQYINTPHCHNGLEKKIRKDGSGHRRPFYVLDTRKAK